MDDEADDLPAQLQEVPFDGSSRGAVDRLIESVAVPALGAPRSEALVRAVQAVTENSVRHGGGHGAALVWRDGRSVICEIRDGGRRVDADAEAEPRADRSAPQRGLQLVHELCDLVQVRWSERGTAVRMTMRAESPAPS